jgi:hypothetical protein
MPVAVELIGVHDQLYKNRAVERTAELAQVCGYFRLDGLRSRVIPLGKSSDFQDEMQFSLQEIQLLRS